MRKSKYVLIITLSLLFLSCKKENSLGIESKNIGVGVISERDSNKNSELLDTAKKRTTYDLKNENFDNWLKLRLDENEISSKIKNNFKDSIYFSEVEGIEIKERVCKTLGLKLFFEMNTIEKNWKLSQIEIICPSKLKTSKGVGIGTNKIDVLMRYQGFINKNDSNIETIVIGDVYNGLFFIFKDDKVNQIILGSLAE